MSSANNNIPLVPENTIDPAAGLNESINVIDALVQLLVVSVGLNTPPGSPAVGSRYIVGTSPTGAWSGQANKLARWLDGTWSFFNARYALNVADGLWYVRPSTTWGVLPGGGGGSASWSTLSGIPANVTAFAELAGEADLIAYFTSDGAMSLASFTEAARTLLAATDAAGQRTAIGLGSVNNTSDANKPISTAQQDAFDGKEAVLTAGANITIDRTDPLAPVISASGGGSGGGDVSTVAGVSPDGSGDIPAASLIAALGVDGKESTLTAGTNISIDRTDPENPVISATGGGGSGVSTVAGIGPDSGGDVPVLPLMEALNIDEKVDKVAGKGLSTNDFTNDLLDKLDGIEDGAQTNVATNLQQGARTATTVVVESSTGTDATLASASTTEAGLMAASDKVRLNGSERTLTPGAGITIDRTNPDAPVIRATGGGTGLPYVSPQQIITSGAELSLTHGLGAAPALTSSELVCTDAEHGYSIGDTIALAPPAFFNAASNGFSLRKNSTNIIVRFGSAAGVFIYVRATDGVAVTLTNARWRLIVRAWA